MNKKELLLKELYKSLQLETFMLSQYQKALSRHPTAKMRLFINESIAFTQLQIKTLFEVIARVKDEKDSAAA